MVDTAFRTLSLANCIVSIVAYQVTPHLVAYKQLPILIVLWSRIWTGHSRLACLHPVMSEASGDA